MKKKIALSIMACLISSFMWACEILVNGNTAPFNICAGQAVTLSLDNNMCVAPFTWMANGVPITNTVNLTPSVNTTYTATDNNGNTYSAFVKVWNAPPVGGATMVNLPYVGCPGTTYTVSTGGNSSISNYTISTPPGTLINGQVSPVTITAGSSFQLTLGVLPNNVLTWEICIFGYNPCGVTNTTCVQIGSQIPQANTFSPFGGAYLPLVCPGEAITVSTSIPGYGHYIGIITGYTWTYPGGTQTTPAGSTSSITFTVPPGFTSGQVCVRADNSNCPTMPTIQRCKTITINPAQPPGPVVANPSTVCTAGTYTFSWGASPGASSYQVNVQIVCPGSTTNNISIVTGTSMQYTLPSNLAPGCFVRVRVNPISPCNNAVVNNATLLTNFSATPVTPVISGPQYGVCGVTTTYGTPGQLGVLSYNWSWSPGITSSGPTTSNYIDLNFPSTGSSLLTISVTASNACATSAPGSLTINPVPRLLLPATVPFVDVYSTNAPYAACDYNVIDFEANTSNVDGVVKNLYKWDLDFTSLVNVPTLIAGGGCNIGTANTATFEMICNQPSTLLEFAPNNDVPYTISLNIQYGNSCGFTSPTPVNFNVDGINITMNPIYSHPQCPPLRAGKTFDEGNDLIYFDHSSERILVKINAYEAAHYNVIISDMSGRSIANKKVSVESGYNNIEINTSGYAKGLYSVSIVEREKVLKKIIAIN